MQGPVSVTKPALHLPKYSLNNLKKRKTRKKKRRIWSFPEDASGSGFSGRGYWGACDQYIRTGVIHTGREWVFVPH